MGEKDTKTILLPPAWHFLVPVQELDTWETTKSSPLRRFLYPRYKNFRDPMTFLWLLGIGIGIVTGLVFGSLTLNEFVGARWAPLWLLLNGVMHVLNALTLLAREVAPMYDTTDTHKVYIAWLVVRASWLIVGCVFFRTSYSTMVKVPYLLVLITDHLLVWSNLAGIVALYRFSTALADE